MHDELTEQYIRDVWANLPRYVKPTTFHSTFLLNQTLGAEVTIASETFQVTGSFKFRAAYNLLAPVEQQEVVTASSGNFGQAAAYACMLLNKRCTVVMPSTSSKTKQAAIRAYGAKVELIDTLQITRAGRIAEILDERPDVFFAPPYDHYRVVAGNSTLGKEIFEALVLNKRAENRIDCVVCPIGGGGLISGIIVARDLLAPEVEIIGAEPLLGNDAARSLREGKLVSLDKEPPTLADGTRTLSVGNLNWEIISKGIKRIVEVPEAQIAEALRTLYRYANLKVEPTGALSTGALLTQPDTFKDKRVCCVVSGGNVDADTYVQILSPSG
ncbi:MAG: threonine/serine dehydratase [Chloroflexia bacterium]